MEREWYILAGNREAELAWYHASPSRPRSIATVVETLVSGINFGSRMLAIAETCLAGSKITISTILLLARSIYAIIYGVARPILSGTIPTWRYTTRCT